MAHLIDLSNNRSNIAYVGQRPWHNLGEKLPEDASIEEWRIAAGLDWTAQKRPAFFGIMDSEGNKKAQPSKNHSFIVRSDTQTELGLVSTNRYNIVQPGEALEFYRDLTNNFGYTLETAGALDDGKRIWALAKTNKTTRIHGTDQVDGYLMFTTSFDGKSSTQVLFTTVRVVCWNTLSYSLQKDGQALQTSISVPHSRAFDEDQVKHQLGIYGQAWSQFEEDANLLASTKLTQDNRMEFFREFFGEEAFDAQIQKAEKNKSNILEKIIQKSVAGIGQDLPSAKNTMWGLVNGVTEYYDHAAQTKKDKRMNSAYFGSAAKQKAKAMEIALKLAS